ncbi:hypothetical protein HDU76_001454 [Blyttiomyces sp. JEL0837]|nr:hypothetical protein HDU76_001454 [Blyttiomyces sp. JEL0837]
MFGVSIPSFMDVWEHAKVKLGKKKLDRGHLMWALYFLKCYPKEGQAASNLKIRSATQYRTKVADVVDILASLGTLRSSSSSTAKKKAVSIQPKPPALAKAATTVETDNPSDEDNGEPAKKRRGRPRKHGADIPQEDSHEWTAENDEKLLHAVKSHYNNLKSKYNAIIAAENATGNKKKPPKRPLCWEALVEHFGDKSGVGVQSFGSSQEEDDQNEVAVDDGASMEVDDNESSTSVANEAREDTPASEDSRVTASTATSATSGSKTAASNGSKTPAIRPLLKKDNQRGRSDRGNITDARDKIGKGLEMLGDKVFMAFGGRKQPDAASDQKDSLDHLATEIKMLASQQEAAAKRQEQIAKEGQAIQLALLEAIKDLKK